MAGVDGVRGGWVVAVVHGRTRVDWAVLPSAADVLEWTAGCAAVGVDVPIGLPDLGTRASDRQARVLLGPARSSVFPTPVRAVLAAKSYVDACALSRAVHGKAISKQVWNIVPGIRQWDRVAPPERVLETHPELSFRAMAPDVRFAAKRGARGAGQRIAALTPWVDPTAALADLPAAVGMDDVLDALACAWSAARWVAGAARELGGERDGAGRPMRIVM